MKTARRKAGRSQFQNRLGISPAFQSAQDRVEKICSQAEISSLENRRFFVLVDRNDHLGIFHSGQVLDRPGDTNGNVQIRCNNLAGLTTCQSFGA